VYGIDQSDATARYIDLANEQGAIKRGGQTVFADEFDPIFAAKVHVLTHLQVGGIDPAASRSIAA
jgi:hypothetical protein